jgi:SAM-dependent methyltransferase
MDLANVPDLAGEGEDMGVITRLPWWAKLVAKLVLARLPVPYGLWRRLGLFRHGKMNVPELALKAFDTYYQRAISHANLSPGFCSLELGPGDSILSGLAARAYGAKRVWLVDAGVYAETDVEACRRMAALLEQEGRLLPDLSGARTLAEVIEHAGIDYLSSGVASLAAIPDCSIDFFWSKVVLEHVAREEFVDLLRELRRVVTPNSVGVHGIDFRDHLGGGLSNMRFSSGIWETHLFRNSGFYTNRIRPSEMLAMFADAGFDVDLIGQTRWPTMPIPRGQLAREFQALSDEDFMVAEIEIILRPRS